MDALTLENWDTESKQNYSKSTQSSEVWVLLESVIHGLAFGGTEIKFHGLTNSCERKASVGCQIEFSRFSTLPKTLRLKKRSFFKVRLDG